MRLVIGRKLPHKNGNAALSFLSEKFAPQNGGFIISLQESN